MILSSSGRGLARVDGTGSFGFVILSSGLYGTTAPPGSLVQAGSLSFTTGGVGLPASPVGFGAPDEDDDDPEGAVPGAGAVADEGGSPATGAETSLLSSFRFGAYRH